MAVSGEPGADFDSKGLGLRIQKKLLGKMSNATIAKRFIDDTTSHLLDTTYRMLKAEFGKKEAEKVIKYIIKIVVKIAILFRNNQFNEQELNLIESFKKSFKSMIMTAVSFHEVDFTYDQMFLLSSVDKCKRILLDVVERHMTPKNKGKIDFVFKHFENTDFLEKVFQSESKYKTQMDLICEDLRKMIEDGNL